MAKSMRSKRRKKMRSLRREKFKAHYDKKLKDLVDISQTLETERKKNTDEMMTEGEDSVKADGNEGGAETSMDLDQKPSETTDTQESERKRLAKVMKAKVPWKLLSQRKQRKLVQKKKDQKRGKKKGLKW